MQGGNPKSAALLLPGTHLRRSPLTRLAVCGIEKQTFEDTGDTEVTDYLPIVRTYTHDGVTMEPKWTRLKSSDSNADSQKEGLRVRLAGGKVKGKDGKTRDQQAIVEFLCEREGDKVRRQLQGRDDDGGDEKKGKPEWEAAKKAEDGVGGTIQFLSYEEDTLRLEWRTKYGCEDAKDDKDDKPKDGDGDGDGEDGGNSSSGGWGFFSWFFFLAFIGILLYFGFSAWINYTRYGAQGWDLIPHSDTIRDIPYILGDWWRKIVGTIGGGGARGGYSAV